MTVLSSLWAKSPRGQATVGESLTDHLAATGDAAAAVASRVGRDDLADALAIAGLLHDTGKVTRGFQRLTLGNPHPDHDAAVGDAYRHRHEVLSLGFIAQQVADPDLRDLVGFLVVSHHRPLLPAVMTAPAGARGRLPVSEQYRLPTDVTEAFRPDVPYGYDTRSADALAEWITTTASDRGLPLRPLHDTERLAEDAAELLDRLVDLHDRHDRHDNSGLPELSTALGLLCHGDHLASAHDNPTNRVLTSDDAIQPIITAGHRPWSHQTTAAELDGHLLFAGPTGSGKTETGLLWAAAQTVPGVRRVAWTLPYLAPLDALRHRLTNRHRLPESMVGAVHSKAASRYLADGNGRSRADVAAAAAKSAMARNLVHPVRVTTPYQLVFGFLGGTRNLPTAADTNNLLMVWDELHAYEPVRLGWMLAVIADTARRGARHAVLSATMPTPLRTLVLEALADTAPAHTVQPDPAAASRERHRWFHHHGSRLTDPTVVEDIRTQVETGTVTLVVANTVRTATELADTLADLSPAVLHSRFTAEDRNRIEQRLTADYGTDSPRPQQPHHLIITTQVCEVSLDIDADLLHTETATLESLGQRAGRVNRGPRADRGVCDVHVHTPVDDDGDLDVPPFYPHQLVTGTIATLDRWHGSTVSADQLADAVDRTYAGSYADRWTQQVTEARDDFTDLFVTHHPSTDSSDLEQQIRDTFESNAHVVPASHVDEYARRLDQTGPLHANQLLVPVPVWWIASRLTTFDEIIEEHVFHGRYTPNVGAQPDLGSPPSRTARAIRPGLPTDTIL